MSDPTASPEAQAIIRAQWKATTDADRCPVCLSYGYCYLPDRCPKQPTGH